MTTTKPAPTVPDADIHALRAFNRFYTRKAGVLGPYLASDLSLTDVRVLYELAHPGDAAPTATDIARKLGHDNGYLSRILKRFENRGWIQRTPNPRDGRQSLLALTPAGREAYAPLEARSHSEAGAIIAPLDEGQRGELMDALETVRRLLGDPSSASAPAVNGSAVAPSTNGEANGMDVDTDTDSGAPPKPKPVNDVVLRDVRAGDLGWVVETHGATYFEEYGWNVEFEALVAEIVADFARTHDPERERAWIAERPSPSDSEGGGRGGERVGCVFVVKGRDEHTAKLRLLCLTPAARGLGLGGKLVDEVIAYARSKGYKRVELWTHSCLVAARGIYAKRGFRLVESEPYVGLGGFELVGENWELQL